MKNTLMWLPLASGFLVMVLSLGVAVLTVNSRNSAGDLALIQQVTQASEAMPSLSLTPESSNFSYVAGKTYSVGIVLDSAEKKVDGVELIINYDPSKVRVVSSSVSANNTFEQYPVNLVCNQIGDGGGKCANAGRIQFSGLTFTPKTIKGIVGTFSFQPLKRGEVNFSFDFVSGATTDSNLALHCEADDQECVPGDDALGKVGNATYFFN